MRRSKREIISTASARLGLTRLLESLPRRSCLIALSYHRIGSPDADGFDPALIEATPEEFDEQMALLRKRYALVELPEFQDLVEKPSRLRGARVLVTFDDGYRDNYEVALPILKSHGVRASFFLATGFVGTPRIPWWDQVAHMLRNARQPRLRVGYPERLEWDLSLTPVQAVIRQMLKVYKRPETRNPERFLSQVEEACQVSRLREASPPLFMTWAQARELVDAGMSVGSHTHNHELLARQSREEQIAECRVSRDLIRERLAVDTDAFAYPVGSPDSYSEVTRECLRETGYRTGFSYQGGVNRPSAMQPLDVARIGLDRSSLAHFRLGRALAALTAHDVW